MLSKIGTLIKAAAILLSVTPAHADVIELGTPRRSLEFQRYLQNTPNLTSLQTAILNEEIEKSEKILLSKYDLAVKGMLLEDLKPSTFVFKEITSWKRKSFLSPRSVDVILQSHMRLAHLDQQNSNFWLKHALFFKPSYKPQEGEFNPLVSDLLEKRRKEINPYLYSVNKSDISDSETLVFMNGVQVLTSAEIHPSGQFNFTFLKNGHEKKSLNIKGEEAAKLKKTSLKPLSLGTCSSPKFEKVYGIQIEKIYFSKDCIRSIQNWQTKKLAENTFENPYSKTNTLSEQSTTPVSSHKQGLFNKRSTWYIIGAAVVTGVLVASLSNRSGTTTVVPTER